MPVWSKTQIRRKAWRQPSECISYKPGEEPKVFTPKPKGKPQTRKTDETAQRLLASRTTAVKTEACCRKSGATSAHDAPR